MWTKSAFDYIAQERNRSPNAFRHLPASQEEFDAEVNRRQRAQVDEAQALLDVGGGGFSFGELAGNMAAQFTDPVTAGTLTLGAPLGASWKATIGIEAALGGADLTLPLIFRDGQMSLGPIPLGAAPRL